MLQLLCTDLRDNLACFGRYGRESPAEIVVCDRNESVPISLEQIKLLTVSLPMFLFYQGISSLEILLDERIVHPRHTLLRLPLEIFVCPHDGENRNRIICALKIKESNPM